MAPLVVGKGPPCDCVQQSVPGQVRAVRQVEAPNEHLGCGYDRCRPPSCRFQSTKAWDRLQVICNEELCVQQ